ncbi:MAG: DinB family protein [Dehalococcoidia bacterium]
METEAIDRLAATPKAIAQLVAEATDAELDSADGHDWSARTIIAHLRDDDSLVFRSRLERMLAEDHPQLVPFDEGAWAASRNRSRDRKEEILGDFALQRQAAINRLRSMSEADWARKGTQPEYGTWTVAGFVEHWLGHDETHIAQLEGALGVTLAEVMERRFGGRS